MRRLLPLLFIAGLFTASWASVVTVAGKVSAILPSDAVLNSVNITSSISPTTGVQSTPILSSITVSAISGGGTAFPVYGIVFDNSTNDNSATTSHMAGGEFVVTEGVTGAKTTSYGTIGRINARSTNAGTAVNYYGVASKMFGSYPSGTTTNNFIGLYTGTCISSDIDCTTAGVNTGTIIDLYIDPSTGGAAHYGVYAPQQGLAHYVGGNLGLGTLSPLSRLHVGSQSEAAAFGTPTVLVEEAGATYLTIRDTTNNVELLSYVDANGGIFGTTTAHSFSLYSSLTPRLTVGSTGNIGVGITTGASLFHVAGAAQFGSAVTVSTFTANGDLQMGDQMGAYTRTKAQINTLVPRRVGAVISCSDCTVPYVLCVATGTLAAQWSAMKTGNGCGGNN